MAYLINRNVSGRLLCLHGLLQYIHHHWGNGPYEISNLKFDAKKSPDIHHFSPCSSDLYGFSSCIYLDNPSSLAGCGLVNSVVEDSQKSKSASDIFNALDGLGFITRAGNSATLTSLGSSFIESDRESSEWERIVRIGVQNYGPFAGLSYLASQFSNGQVWTRSSVSLGFANTNEVVNFGGQKVHLSMGSQDDTITRSRSSLISWGIAAGYFYPKNFKDSANQDLPSQVKHYSYLMGPRWTDGFLNTGLVYEERSEVVQRPLSYDRVVKSVRSLREQGQSAQRQASIQWESVVKNRRLAIAFLLHQSAKMKQPIAFEDMVVSLVKHREFVVNREEFSSTMQEELKNAFVIGTPYKVIDGNSLLGLRQVNLEVLNEGAPTEVLQILNENVLEDLFK